MAKVLLAILVTAALLSMAVAAAAMVYETTLPYPGIGKKAGKVVTVLWLWPVATVGFCAMFFGLGWLWGWAL